MKIGFVTFCTEDYLCVLHNLIDSLLSFSKYEIVVYTINFEHNFNDERVKTKKINIDNVNFFNICKSKIYSAVDCDLDIGLCIDCDMIATPEIDNIFNENIERVIESEFPLFAKHPHKPLISNAGWRDAISHYTDKPNDNWVYATFLFSNKNKWFLSEVLDEMWRRPNQAGEDELIINGLLSKYNVDYDIGYNYLPNALTDMIKIYFGELKSTIDNDTYLMNNCPLKYYLFHAHLVKNCESGKELLERLKNKK